MGDDDFMGKDDELIGKEDGLTGRKMTASTERRWRLQKKKWFGFVDSL